MTPTAPAGRPGMCADCCALIGAKRGTPRHAALVRGDSRDAPTHVGGITESDFTCAACGYEWLYETGRAGMGWVDFPKSK
jgi:hypothetical protein